MPDVTWGMLVFALQAASTCAMAGLVWFVQIVHYPLMARADRTDYPSFAKAHASRTTRIVAPLMLIEAATAMLIVLGLAGPVAGALAWSGIVLLAGVWISTFAVQVPLHEKLAAGWSEATHRRLVHTNWLRTAAWSLRSVIAVLMLATRGGPP